MVVNMDDGFGRRNQALRRAIEFIGANKMTDVEDEGQLFELAQIILEWLEDNNNNR